MDVIGYLYGVIIMAGGVVGYVTKGSLMSAGMGGGLGLLALYAAYRSSRNPQNWVLSLLVSLTVAGVMGARFMKSGKVMPAGLVAGISLLVVVRYGYRAVTLEPEKTEEKRT